MIEVRDATKRYGETLVVDSVNLTLPKGGITSIIGPNGAGKSTLLSMMARLLPMDGGRVLVDGLDVAKTPGETLARRLSILKQENHILSRLTVRDLVTFGRYPHTKGRPTIDDRDRVEQAIAWLGLEPEAGRFLDELSGGQRQRAFVAMVLCQDTDYVLLDEPLNNLDMRHAVSMMTRLRRASDELGKTIVVVLHDINFAAWHSDRIVAMREGRILFEGPPSEIMRPELLKTLYDLDIRIHRIEDRPTAIYFGFGRK